MMRFRQPTIIWFIIIVCVHSALFVQGSTTCRRVNVKKISIHPDDFAINSPEFYQSLFRLRQPLILQGSHLPNSWPVKTSDDFTLKSLMKRFPVLPALRQTSSYSARAFATAHSDKPLQAFVPVDVSTFNAVYNVSSECILGVNESSESHSSCMENDWAYFSARSTKLPPDLRQQISPIEDLIMPKIQIATTHEKDKQKKRNTPPEKNNQQMNFWLGRKGIITHTHFDLQWNAFYQHLGTKRFTLFSPQTPLHLYPNIHPHQAHVAYAPSELPIPYLNQCQADNLKEDQQQITMTTEPTSNENLLIDLHIAELAPGDLLILPPLWFHHVETLSTSVSINVWSDADEYTLLNHLYTQPVPLELSWSESDRVLALIYYFHLMVSHAFPATTKSTSASTSASASASAEPSFAHSDFEEWFTHYLLQQRYHAMIEYDQQLAKLSGHLSSWCRSTLHNKMSGTTSPSSPSCETAEAQTCETDEPQSKQTMTPSVQESKSRVHQLLSQAKARWGCSEDGVKQGTASDTYQSTTSNKQDDVCLRSSATWGIQRGRWHRGLNNIVPLLKQIHETVQIPFPLKELANEKLKEKIRSFQATLFASYPQWEEEMNASKLHQADSILSLLLANYFEWILSLIIGEDQVLPFFQQCLGSNAY